IPTASRRRRARSFRWSNSILPNWKSWWRRRRRTMPGDTTPRGPLGDVRPDARQFPAAPTPGSLKPEKVEHRGNVGTVKPEDYPIDQRARLDDAAANRGRRAGTGSGPATGSGADAPVGRSR